MIMDTNELAGHVRAAEAGRTFPPALLSWGSNFGWTGLMTARTPGGLRPREHASWLSRAWRAEGDWFKVMVPAPWTNFDLDWAAPDWLNMATLRDWQAQVRLLRWVPKANWVMTLLMSEHRAEVRWEQPTGLPHVHPPCGPSPLAAALLSGEMHQTLNRAAADMLLGALKGSCLQQADPLLFDLFVEIIKPLKLPKFSYFDEFFGGWEAAWGPLTSAMRTAGLRHREPEAGGLPFDWDEERDRRLRAGTAPPLLGMHPVFLTERYWDQTAAVSDWLYANMDLLLDLIHLHAGQPPLTEADLLETWRCAFSGWTEAQHVPPMYAHWLETYCLTEPSHPESPAGPVLTLPSGDRFEDPHL